jgi:hypothetical protein
MARPALMVRWHQASYSSVPCTVIRPLLMLFCFALPPEPKAAGGLSLHMPCGISVHQHMHQATQLL